MAEILTFLSGMSRFLGLAILIFGAVSFALHLHDMQRVTGPVLLMIAGGMIAALGPVFAADAAAGL